MSGGSKSNNDSIIAEQRRQEEERARTDAAKQDRLRAGRERIQAMFSPTGGTFTGPGSYTEQAVYGQRKPFGVNTKDEYIVTGRGDEELRTRNPHYGKDLSQPVQVGTQQVFNPGETTAVAGIGQDFYDGFKNSILDYYKPEVERQHTEAKEQSLFDLARRGLMRSSTAADRAADLVRERADADAKVQLNAEGQTSNLRSDVAGAQSNALQLLQMTEDPTAAANQAATEINAIQTRTPQFSDLGNLFASGLQGLSNYNTMQAARKGYEAIPGSSPHKSAGRLY